MILLVFFQKFVNIKIEYTFKLMKTYLKMINIKK